MPPLPNCRLSIPTASSAPGFGLLAFFLVLFSLLLAPTCLVAQGTEDFQNMPANSTAYQNRSWTGTDGVTWTATGARTDQTMTGRAICFGNAGNNPRAVTSPIYANGMGILSFEYSKAFTSLSARSLQVWVNGMQIGPDIVVNSAEPPVVDSYNQAINIGGAVQLEIRSTGGANSQVKLDNIVWTPYVAGPTASFSAASQSTPEGSGVVPVTFNISPATVTGGIITLNVANGPGVVYGAGGDYTTAPAGGSGTINLNVPPGATTASFNVNLINDPYWEPNKDITFSITGVTGDMAVGFPNTHVFTILNDDFTPTAFFGSPGSEYLENAGTVNISITITPAAAAGTLTLDLVNGPGAVYGADYTTVPDGSGGSITVNVPAGATVVNIPVTLIDDTDVEDTETVTFTITGATGGLLFGPSSVHVLSIGDNDGVPTVLAPGDLVILAVNANNNACGGTGGEDEVSFMCFQDIRFGTTLDLTDQGYSRCYDGLWGTNEGLIRITRNGGTIPAGTVITLRFNGSGGVAAIMPVGGWDVTVIGGHNFLNLNSSGDQLFFMQGGTWTNPGTPIHSASYVGGTILYGFSTNGQWVEGLCSSNLNSGLPLQMECFSMEPTAASDWTKYTGPLTATTQRGWIIRIGDPTNWTSYSSCANYNAGAPFYSAGLVLPITTVGFTAGLWTGGVSTDWFDCRNWDDARIPNILDDVRIDQTAIRSCVVGTVINSVAVCASVYQVSNAANRQLTVQNSSELQISGPLRIERLTAGGPLTTTVTSNSTLYASSIEVGDAGGTGGAVLRCDLFNTRLVVEGDVTIGPGSVLDLQGASEGGNLELGGDFTNMNTEAAFHDLMSTVIFNGNGDQTISVGAGSEFFNNLVVDKTGGDLVLASPVEVRAQLDLSGGRVLSSNTEMLTLRGGGTAINFSDASFVHGPMVRIGNTDFTFPVGKGAFLRPCGLRDIVGNTAVAFRAEYFPASPRITFNDVLEPTLDHISDCEYWMIDRVTGIPNAVVELTWRDPMSCGVTDLPSLRVARWDGAMWLDRGNGGATGNTFGGTVPTAAVQTLFSPWTLASVNSENPLPISLVSFTAKPEGREVRLDWTTASERDNAYFTVERSADGLDFEGILQVPGALNSQQLLHYTDLDPRPYSGLNYYRLRQTDLDGTDALSAVVTVWMSGDARPSLAVHAGEAMLSIFHGFEPGAHYTLLDMTGRLVANGTTQQEGTFQLSLGALPHGAYIFRMEDGLRSESVRFVR